MPRLRFAGQVTGCEGYVERGRRSHGGSLRGRGAARPAVQPLPETTALRALINHITGGHIETIDDGPRSFQPMNVNFGLFPPLERTPNANDGKRLRGAAKALAKKRALTDRPARSRRVARRQRDPGGGRIRHGALDPRRVPADRWGHPAGREIARRAYHRARAPTPSATAAGRRFGTGRRRARSISRR